MPPSITKWPMCMFWGCSSRANDCARPLNPNFPIANTEERGKPLTAADALVKKIFPSPFFNILFAACCATRKPP